MKTVLSPLRIVALALMVELPLEAAANDAPADDTPAQPEGQPQAEERPQIEARGLVQARYHLVDEKELAETLLSREDQQTFRYPFGGTAFLTGPLLRCRRGRGLGS